MDLIADNRKLRKNVAALYRAVGNVLRRSNGSFLLSGLSIGDANMQSVSWKDILHYGAGLGLIVLGVLGELGVPGIDAKICFITGAGILGAGLKGGWVSGNGTKLVIAALIFGFAASLAFPALAQTKTPAPTSIAGKPTVAAAVSNPLLAIQQFTVSDLQAALADAQSQSPPDTSAINCYTALLSLVQNNAQSPLPKGLGAFQALQKARDAKAVLANLQSPNGPLAGLNTACAPLVLDAQNTLITLGVSVGLVSNPAGATAALAGLPAAVAAFLALPKL